MLLPPAQVLDRLRGPMEQPTTLPWVTVCDVIADLPATHEKRKDTGPLATSRRPDIPRTHRKLFRGAGKSSESRRPRGEPVGKRS
jgi:hypothetical protein